MGSTLGLQVRDAGSNPVLVHFHSSWPWIDPLTLSIENNLICDAEAEITLHQKWIWKKHQSCITF